jgi:hypothetical protein
MSEGPNCLNSPSRHSRRAFYSFHLWPSSSHLFDCCCCCGGGGRCGGGVGGGCGGCGSAAASNVAAAAAAASAAAPYSAPTRPTGSASPPASRRHQRTSRHLRPRAALRRTNPPARPGVAAAAAAARRGGLHRVGRCGRRRGRTPASPATGRKTSSIPPDAGQQAQLPRLARAGPRLRPARGAGRRRRAAAGEAGSPCFGLRVQATLPGGPAEAGPDPHAGPPR